MDGQWSLPIKAGRPNVGDLPKTIGDHLQDAFLVNDPVRSAPCRTVWEDDRDESRRQPPT